MNLQRDAWHRALRAVKLALPLVLASAALGAATEAAQAQSAPAAAAIPSAGAAADYMIGPGDVIGVAVYRSPEMTSMLTVDTSGAVLFPEIGRVLVANHTTAEVAGILERELRARRILIDPQVNVIVSQLRARRISVMGAVARPGEISIDRPSMMLSSVLAISGTSFGTGSAIVTIIAKDPAGAGTTRKQVLLARIISGEEDRPARDEDVLVVQAPSTAYVSGEVGRPGAYPLEPNMTVGQALALAGGVSPRGAANRLRVTRTPPDGTQVLLSDVKSTDPVQPDALIQVRQRIF